ncbi:MAG: FAD binding domain-containing protein [Myxococcales bacterium]|nr:FAD binding domain-containing protein [Myxococcales bacterium]
MLRLPRLRVVSPTRIDDALAALAEPGARALAGGTDLLPNLKHRLAAPTVLVDLGRLPLRHVAEVDGELRVGAGVILADLAAHPLVRARAPSLALAAGRVAGPTLRNLATLGGNLHADTRCRYVNQTALWRDALGGCLKSHGDRCHVVPGGQQCVAALSSDCVPVLISLDAQLVLRGRGGERTIALVDYYRADGTAHTARAPGELATEVRIPIAPGPRRATYVKWTVRRSIDFPLISIALAFDLTADLPDAMITRARVVVGALAATPRVLRKTDAVCGQPLSAPATADVLAELIARQCRPLPNLPYDPDYRHQVLPVHLRRGLATLIAGAT